MGSISDVANYPQPMEIIEDSSFVFNNMDNIQLSNEKPQRKLQHQQKVKKNKDSVESKFRDPQLNDLILTDQPNHTLGKLDSTAKNGIDEIETKDSEPAAVEPPLFLDLDRLISKHIEIYWDGDRIFYPCTIVRRLSESPADFNDTAFAEYVVLYENDDSKEEYTERLSLSLLVRRQSPRLAGSTSTSSFIPTQSIPADSASIWRLWDGDDEDYATFLQQQMKLRNRVSAIYYPNISTVD